MISCLTECGRVGLTAVGDTPDDAWRIYEEAQAALPPGGGGLHSRKEPSSVESPSGNRRSCLVRRLWIQHVCGAFRLLHRRWTTAGRPPYLRGMS